LRSRRRFRYPGGTAAPSKADGARLIEAHAGQFVGDSPLEEGVTSEPVSEAPKFPASRENTGNFIDFGSPIGIIHPKEPSKSMPYRQIPYATEQGIKWAAAGN
jgi:hypothetical protein